MKLKIDRIIIWPKDQSKNIREITFDPNKTNVISGDSERGKSAIISIIDYVLGSEKCSIPSGLIRENSSWFGVLFKFQDHELLLARKDPVGDRVSNEYLKIEESKVEIPNDIEPNYHLDDIKSILNEYAHLTRLDFSLKDKVGFDGAPSFRDVISLNFQPQYIVANPFTLFYKTDSYEHRETFKSVFPYLIGAIDDQDLQLKEELKSLRREESRKTLELINRRKVVENWIAEVKTYFNVAQEYGLIDDSIIPEENWTFLTYYGYLSAVPERLKSDRTILVSEGSNTKSANRAANLKDREYIASNEMQILKDKLILINNLGLSNNAYRISTENQVERIKGVGWLLEKIENQTPCPFCSEQSTDSADYIKSVQKLQHKLAQISNKISDSRKVLSKEALSIQMRLKDKERELNSIRTELKNLEFEDGEFRLSRQTINSIFYFTGQLDQALRNYHEASDESELVSEIDFLKNRILEIESGINDEALKKRKESALLSIGKLINHYAGIFLAERSNSNIKIDLDHLSLKFLSQDGRESFLWQIGSGHNHVAYHISTILAIHEYLLSLEDNKVPQFIIFDQPSQAYFPEGIAGDGFVSGDDIVRLRRIFEAFQDFMERTNQEIQIIVLEHAGEEAWSNLDKIDLRKRWRDGESDDALIPKDWYN